MVGKRAQWRKMVHPLGANKYALLFCLFWTAASAYGQGLAGRWAATGRTLDNGEQEKSILELKQDGNELRGTVTTLGGSSDVKGTATGNHFELYGAWNAKRPFLVGDLVNGEIHAAQGRRQWVAKPATAADDLPKIAYIEPPPLQHRSR